MSIIKDLLKDEESILVFDIDGVLAVMEFDKRNHFFSDEKWNQKLKKGINVYVKDRMSPKLKSFIDTKDINKIYVITKVNADIEIKHKTEFVNKYYNILKENIYFVKTEEEKLNKILQIKEKHKELDDSKIIMIDDTVNVLNNILNNTNFSTAHVSSLLDII